MPLTNFSRISFLILLLSLLFSGCSNKPNTKSGFIEIQLDNGFNFASKTVINLDESTQETFTNDVATADLYIRADQAPSTPGNPPNPWVFTVIGSPVGDIQSDGMTILYIVSSNSQKPAIKMLDKSNIDNVSKISKDGFQPELTSLTTNQVYAIITQDDRYAIFEISEIDTISDYPTVSFDWKLNKDGERIFK
jgi:hypothetical protein